MNTNQKLEMISKRIQCIGTPMHNSKTVYQNDKGHISIKIIPCTNCESIKEEYETKDKTSIN